MIAWPEMGKTVGVPVPAPTVTLAPPTSASDAPALQPADRTAPAANAGPVLPPATVPSQPTRRVRHRAALVTTALFASLVLHAAAIAWIARFEGPDGIESAADAISVEIVLEAPPVEQFEPVAGNEVVSAAAEPVEAEEVRPVEQTAALAPSDVEPEQAIVPAPAAPVIDTEPAEQPDPAPTAQAPEPPAEAAASPPATAATEPVTPMDNAAPSEPQEEATATPADAAATPAEAEPIEPEAEHSQALAALSVEPALPEPEADPVLPATDDIPLPTARPAPDQRAPDRQIASAPARSEPRQAEPRRAPARQQPKAPPRERPRQAEARTPPRVSPERAGTPSRREASIDSRRGAASAGAEAGFSRRLLAHVERHKRYPAEAQRQRLTGATRLAITIDRNGRLSAARVTSGSGHAVLDSEAMAVARRAAPYPRPPEGVGGGTISFAVTLRFSR